MEFMFHCIVLRWHRGGGGGGVRSLSTWQHFVIWPTKSKIQKSRKGLLFFSPVCVLDLLQGYSNNFAHFHSNILHFLFPASILFIFFSRCGWTQVPRYFSPMEYVWVVSRPSAVITNTTIIAISETLSHAPYTPFSDCQTHVHTHTKHRLFRKMSTVSPGLLAGFQKEWLEWKEKTHW